MPSIPCAVFTCMRSHRIRHRFPDPKKNMFLFTEWVKLCANPRLREEGMTPAKIYNSCRVCHYHFTENDIGPNDTLKREVIPFVTENVIQSVSVTRSPIQQVSLDAQEYELGKPEHPLQSVPDTPIVASTASTSRCITPFQSGRHGLLAEVGQTRIADLTPKAKYLYEKARYYQKRAAQSSRTKLSFKKRLQLATRYTEADAFVAAISTMDKIRGRFFQCQMENSKKKIQGRRYSIEDKVLGLALYKQSGSGYKLLSKLFTLPSQKTCMRLLQRIPIRPGLSEPTFEILKAEVKNFKNPLDKYCLLMFDEMALSPSLSWNQFDGDVEGFEDFGFKRTNKIANHVMVCMLRGLSRKWKQPVYYNFVNGATSNADIVNIIKTIIIKCTNIGLRVVATVCDQGKNNEAAINNLVNETKKRYGQEGKQFEEFAFELNNNLVIPLFDPPHLLKGIRNNLLKSNLLFHMNGKQMMAKWSHILDAYKLDPYLGSLNKMKVSYCTQIFSRSVAVGINLMAYSGTTFVDENGKNIFLDKDAQETAKLLELFDDIFDSLNGSSLFSQKLLRRAITEESEHFKFWNNSIPILAKMEYISKEGKKYVPPSLKNLLKTIKNMKFLFEILKKEGFSYLMPRMLNQDPVENFSSKIRQRGARNNNPTCSQFTGYYKSVLVNTMVSTHSVGANCMEDDAEYLITLQRFVTQGLPEDVEEQHEEEQFTKIPVVFSTVQPIEQVLRYVCGYLFKKIETNFGNCSCKEDILQKSNVESNAEFLKLKEYDNRRRLKYISDTFYEKMKLALQIIKFVLYNDLHKKGVFKYIFCTSLDKINLTNCQHNLDLKKNNF